MGENEYLLEIRNQIKTGEEIEILRPNSRPIQAVFPEMIHNKSGEILNVANPNTMVRIKIDKEMAPMDMMRRRGDK